jgi:uncharacterized protein YbcI
MPAGDGSGGCVAEETPQDVRLNTALARAVVRIRQRYVGRGPAKATAFFRRQHVVVVMEQTMTTAEKSLVADGNGNVVSAMRSDLERAMELEMTQAVEELTGCGVTALMSGSNFEPDMACQVYALDRPIPGRR